MAGEAEAAKVKTYHSSGTYKTQAGNIGTFTYRAIKAASLGEADDIAMARVRARKSYMGGASWSTSEVMPA